MLLIFLFNMVLYLLKGETTPVKVIFAKNISKTNYFKPYEL